MRKWKAFFRRKLVDWFFSVKTVKLAKVWIRPGETGFCFTAQRHATHGNIMVHYQSGETESFYYSTGGNNPEEMDQHTNDLMMLSSLVVK